MNSPEAEPLSRPNDDSYVIPGARLAAGPYPGVPPSTPAAIADVRLDQFLDAGITAFIDLTDPADRLAPYADRLRTLAARRGMAVTHEQLTIRDFDVCAPDHMTRVLDTIDARLAEGRAVYVHCWGGIGRTGMTIGCWLVRHGRSGEEALTEVARLFASMSSARVARHYGTGSPQTEPQREMVRQWASHEPPMPEPPMPDPPMPDPPMPDRAVHASAVRERALPAPAPTRHERYVGALLGLAVGDALGTTLEFAPPGTFETIDTMIGGGPFGLAPGQWTDDTSMAMCLAESLVERGGFDAVDQLTRYVRWADEGHWSSTGRCFDIGNVVREALATFRATGRPFCGPTRENSAGNGSLMRLAPVPLFFASDPELAIRMSADSSRTTHGTTSAVDACRYFAALLLGALGGVSRDALLAPMYSPVPGLWDREPLHPAIAAIAAGSFRTRKPPQIRATGYVVQSLQAALWAFASTSDFRSGALAAVNLGDDADTTGAIFGQLGGAYYGVDAIPAEWRDTTAMAPEIAAMAGRLMTG